MPDVRAFDYVICHGVFSWVPRPVQDAILRICRDALAPLVLSGQASVSILPLHIGRAADARPRVWAFARMEAASGQPWVTSLCHVGVAVYPVLRALLPYLDGLHDRAALRRLFIDAMASDALEITELPAGYSSEPAERLDAMAEHHVEQTLRYCAWHALLEPHAS